MRASYSRQGIRGNYTITGHIVLKQRQNYEADRTKDVRGAESGKKAREKQVRKETKDK